MQRNWIGRSEGLLIRFELLPTIERKTPKIGGGGGAARSMGFLTTEEKVEEIPLHKVTYLTEIEVYTTRPDTLFGAKFVALAPDHPLAEAAAQREFHACRLRRRMSPSQHLRRRGGDH